MPCDFTIAVEGYGKFPEELQRTLTEPRYLLNDVNIHPLDSLVRDMPDPDVDYIALARYNSHRGLFSRLPKVIEKRRLKYNLSIPHILGCEEDPEVFHINDHHLRASSKDVPPIWGLCCLADYYNLKLSLIWEDTTTSDLTGEIYVQDRKITQITLPSDNYKLLRIHERFKIAQILEEIKDIKDKVTGLLRVKELFFPELHSLNKDSAELLIEAFCLGNDIKDSRPRIVYAHKTKKLNYVL